MEANYVKIDTFLEQRSVCVRVCVFVWKAAVVLEILTSGSGVLMLTV